MPSESKPKDDKSKSQEKPPKDKDKKAQKDRSVEEIDAEIWATMIKDSLGSHGGWLGSLVLQSGNAGIGTTMIPMLLVVGATLFILLIALPPSVTFHMSASLTLVIPLQNTLKSIALGRKSSSKAKDSAQWLAYWVTYTFLGMTGGWIGIVRPAWAWLFEIWKTLTLVILAGPWYGRQILLPEKTALTKERESAEAREKNTAQAAAGGADAKTKEEAKKREKDKAKAKAKAADEAEKEQKQKAKAKDDKAQAKAKAKAKDDKVKQDKSEKT